MKRAILIAVLVGLFLCAPAYAGKLTFTNTYTAIFYTYDNLALSLDGKVHIKRCHRLAYRRIRCRVRIAGPRTRCKLSVAVRESCHGDDQWVLRTRWLRCRYAPM